MQSNIQIQEYLWGYTINEFDSNGILTRKIKRFKHDNGMIMREEIYNVNDRILSIEEWSYDDANRIIGNKVVDQSMDVKMEQNFVYDHLGRLIMVHKRHLNGGILFMETIISKLYE